MTIEAIDWVRSRPQQFFPPGPIAAVQIAAYVMADVMLLGGESCVVRRFGDWWIVAGERNWLQHETIDVEALFRRVVPDPRQGNHSMRSEIIVAAFATQVSAISDGRVYPVKGLPPSGECVSVASGMAAAIMFSLVEASEQT